MRPDWRRWGSEAVAIAAVALALALGPAPTAADDEPGPAPQPTVYADDILPFGTARIAHGSATGEADKAREAGVDEGLAWLAAHQAPDGRFAAEGFATQCNGAAYAWPEGLGEPGLGGAQHDVGVTGLALTAFLQAGYSPRGRHPYAKVVRRGLRWLLAEQKSGGEFVPLGHPKMMFEHSFATLAVVNAYAMSGSPFLRRAVTSALIFAQACRTKAGGFAYGAGGDVADPTVTAVALLPTYTAAFVNLGAKQLERVPPFAERDTDRTLAGDSLRTFVDAENGRGAYSVERKGPKRYGEARQRFPAMHSECITAMAVLLWEGPDRTLRRRPLVQKMLERIYAVPPRWLPKTGTVDLMYWWFGAMAMHRARGKRATRWLEDVHRELLAAQRKDGDRCSVLGSWDPAGVWGREGGRVYATAMGCLTLSAYAAFPWEGGAKTSIVALADSETTEPERRLRALAAAAATPSKRGTHAAMKSLEAKDADVRRQGAVVLGRIGPPASSPAVLGRLAQRARADEDTRVRRAATWAIGRVSVGRSGARTRLPPLTDEMEPGVRFLREVALAQIRGKPHPALRGSLRYVPDPELLLRAAEQAGIETGLAGPAEPAQLTHAIAHRLDLPARIDLPRAPVGTERPLIPLEASSHATGRQLVRTYLDVTGDTNAGRAERAAAARVILAEGADVPAALVTVTRLLMLQEMAAELRMTSAEQTQRGTSRAQLLETGPLIVRAVREGLKEAPDTVETRILRAQADYVAGLFAFEGKQDGEPLRAAFFALDRIMWELDGSVAARHLLLRKAAILVAFADRTTDPGPRASLVEGALLLLEDAGEGDVRRPPDRHLVMQAHAARARLCRESGRIGGFNFLRRAPVLHQAILRRVPDLGADAADVDAIVEMALLHDDSGDQNRALAMLKRCGARAHAAGHIAVSKRLLEVRKRMLRGE